jgi:hypothetical protein
MNFLMGSGIRSAKFGQPGDMVTGRVVDKRISQQTDIQTGEPQNWPNGDPKLQLVVTLQTTLREDSEDDGFRNLYVKGSQKAGSKSLHAAVADAVRGSGAKDLENGGVLTVQYVGDEPSTTRGMTDRKLYAATFQRGSGSEASATFLGTGAPAPQDAPWQQPQAQPQANGWQTPAQSSGPTWAATPAVQQPSPPMPPEQPQQPAMAPAGPSTDDLARFEAWKASQQAG